MAKGTCSEGGCEKPVKARGRCQKHYKRWYEKAVRRGEIAVHRSPVDRFRAKVHVGSGPDDCWEWTGSLTPGGYGQMSFGYGHVRAHRFSYETFVGPIRDGLWVLHRCDNPSCVRPDHLFLGTHRDNMDDAVAKGRMGGNGMKMQPCGTLAAYRRHLAHHESPCGACEPFHLIENERARIRMAGRRRIKQGGVTSQHA